MHNGETCKFCGQEKSEHVLKTFLDGGTYLTRLVGAGDHLFDPLWFPLSTNKALALDIQRRMAQLQHDEGWWVMLNELKTGQIPSMSMEQLIAVSMWGQQYRDAYVGRGLEAPAWVETRRTLVEREIERRAIDDLEKELEAAKAEEAKLRTVDEKRAGIREHMESLRQQIAKITARG